MARNLERAYNTVEVYGWPLMWAIIRILLMICGPIPDVTVKSTLHLAQHVHLYSSQGPCNVLHSSGHLGSGLYGALSGSNRVGSAY